MTAAATDSTQGFIAVSRPAGATAAPDLAATLAGVGVSEPVTSEQGSIAAATWGLDGDGFDRSKPLLLCREARRREHSVGLNEVRRLLAHGSGNGLGEVLPSFAAVDQVDADTVVGATDALGFRHLYYGERRGSAVLSTSARAVAACLGNDLDREAVALQSLLGWQLGERTLFSGVRKLGAGDVATLAGGRISISSPAPPEGRVGVGLDAAVREAATVLRDYMDALLDDHPDAVLQLTGGQDSRLLLSAVSPARRRGLRSLTLGLPGNPDFAIASDLSRRYGLVHETLHLGGLETVSSSDADRWCLDAARQLECMADPLAHAALNFAESRAEPGVRIGGLGGEVARGFYYLGPVTGAPVTRKRVERLTRWRMFVNESVSADALDPGFADWSREFAVDEVFALCSATGRDWMEATDEFYLYQRMQRWAGVLATALCFERVAVNPMLDDRFIAIARGLAPRDKRNSMFLSRLQVELDAELARIPLDDRPPPIAYASTGAMNTTRQVASTARKAARKIRQRASRANRPPAGGEILAGKVVEHWRANPEVLDPTRAMGVFRDQWLDGVLAGEVDPSPSAVALVTNLRVAGESLRG
jgi:asparagine synthase (glutamine-hydrolysing)